MGSRVDYGLVQQISLQTNIGLLEFQKTISWKTSETE
jgi:hypothetical protein